MEWNDFNKFISKYLCIGIALIAAYSFLKMPVLMLSISAVFIAMVFTYRATKHLTMFVPFWVAMVSSISFLVPNYEDYAMDSSVGKEYVFLAANALAIAVTLSFRLLKKSLKKHPVLATTLKAYALTMTLTGVMYVFSKMDCNGKLDL